MPNDGINEILADHDKQDRRITWVLVLSAIVVVLVGLGTPAVISTSNTAREVRDGNAILACRAIANADVSGARAQLDLARTRVEIHTSRALEAVATRDDDDFAAAVSELPKARSAVEEATARLLDVTHQYQTLVEESQADPDATLRECG